MLFLEAFLAIFINKETRPLLYAFLATIGSGTIAYHFIEGWRWIDSAYFSVITLATVGYGDFHPVTDFGKIFTIIYIIIGLGLFLTFINVYFSHVRAMGGKSIRKVKERVDTARNSKSD